MYKIFTTKKYDKSLVRCLKRGLNLEPLKVVIDILQEKGTLPAKYKPHKLQGAYIDCWECHIKPDWLLIWKQNNKELILLFVDTGTHADLF